MTDKMLSDPRTHYGSGRTATRHFITQRLTGAASVLFTLFFVWLVLRLAGADRAEMVGVIAHPVVAIVLALLIVTVCVHMRIGMREVIDDYAADPRQHSLSSVLNTLFVLVVAVVALVAIAKIAFWG